MFLLGQLALYAVMAGADLDFVDAVTPSLVISLPEPPPGMLPEDRDPDDPGDV
ncbi:MULTISPECIES: hypothetical protein [Streptomyces]|uniref:hypothetical protein n=1 Tax=Streptomyces TaxID=1883 RepID=UPI0013E89991|nr:MULTISPECIES: hypothetical protein [Streptomyces]